MFTQTWSTSPATYGVTVERDVSIPLSGGLRLDCAIIKPDRPGRYPVLLGVHAYSKADQLTDLMPEGMSHKRGHMEAGDSAFFARRGYVHVVANISGTGRSGGYFGNLNRRSISEIAEAVEWIAEQPWSNRRVAMTGVSYFSIVSQRVAALAPPSLKCIWAPYGWNDAYRDRYYQGGILSYGFMRGWLRNVDGLKVDPELIEHVGSTSMKDELERLKADSEIASVDYLAQALQNPQTGFNPLIVDILAHALDGPHWHERSLDYSSRPQVPATLGGCWGIYGLHLPGAFRAWEKWQGARRMLVGPPVYLDRPVYQYQYDQLRWFDLWLKENDTGVLDEPPLQLFIDGTGEWRDAGEWPLPQTRWTPFYLHSGGLLSEREPFRDADVSPFQDAPGARGELRFTTPPVVEVTEICGPIALKLFATTTDREILWFASLLLVEIDGSEHLLTRGWLRGSQRRIDEAGSTPWQPRHLHTDRQSVPPGEVVEYNIEMRPYGIQLRPGQRLSLRLKCADDEKPKNDLEWIAQGHLARRSASTVGVHHGGERHSCLLLPVTRGNRIGTFMSGGSVLLSS